MRRYFSYLSSAVNILEKYNGQEPFSLFIQSFFKQNKKMGSRDRKLVRHFCYSFFRLGKALPGFSIDKKIIAGLFLTTNEPTEYLSVLAPEWNEKAKLPWLEKFKLIDENLAVEQIFPFENECDKNLSVETFVISFLEQPDLFLRIRPGFEKTVKEKLGQEKIQYKMLREHSISISGSIKIENILDVNKEIIIQDFSSQRIGDFFSYLAHQQQLRVWDCCAGSGGKSILAKDLLGQIDLTVSDNRTNILHNLQKRFLQAGIEKYNLRPVDLSGMNMSIRFKPFDFIIADVPCTGSGTWSRTPEQLFYFEEKKIEEYVQLQKRILKNVVRFLKPGGKLFYITCSVFQKENEAMVEFIQIQFKMKVLKLELLEGMQYKADTMFAAMLEKSL
ncbi:MAG: Fmu (Sun) domain-containing protein [Chitinophagaceae bacterium]|nr:Fmu (Sun) domain-containing protein [Chitinophagaceae bacterium]